MQHGRWAFVPGFKPPPHDRRIEEAGAEDHIGLAPGKGARVGRNGRLLALARVTQREATRHGVTSLSSERKAFVIIELY